jgi:hypothetical protein
MHGGLHLLQCVENGHCFFSDPLGRVQLRLRPRVRLLESYFTELSSGHIWHLVLSTHVMKYIQVIFGAFMQCREATILVIQIPALTTSEFTTHTPCMRVHQIVNLKAHRSSHM